MPCPQHPFVLNIPQHKYSTSICSYYHQYCCLHNFRRRCSRVYSENGTPETYNVQVSQEFSSMVALTIAKITMMPEQSFEERGEQIHHSRWSR